MATSQRHMRQVLPDERAPQPAQPDWAAQTADTIERAVVGLRSKTTDPIERVVRIVVYGIVAAVLGITVVVLLTIALVRALDIVLPSGVWAADLLLGGIFTIVGLFLWTRRRGRPAR